MDDGYIELENYGVKLKRLTHDKIELVRQWRNDPKISKYMFYKEYITPEMQEHWFVNLDIKRDYYFIVEYARKEIGLINIKNINLEERFGESGVFIYDDKYLGSDISYRAHLVLFDYVYSCINLLYTFSEIQLTNKQAMRFSVYLGARKIESDEMNDKAIYIICSEDYFSNTNRARFIKKWNLQH